MPTTRPPLLLATDRSASVIQRVDADTTRITYSPFGFNPDEQERGLLGFNGQPHSFSKNAYLLGSGYRAFNVILQRFTSPDSYSPFGAGGLNAYAYCAGDPVNYADPSGHARGVMSRLRKFFGFGKTSAPRAQNDAARPVTNLFPSDEEFPPTGIMLDSVLPTRNTRARVQRDRGLGAPPRQVQTSAPPNSTVEAPPSYASLTELPPPTYTEVMRTQAALSSPAPQPMGSIIPSPSIGPSQALQSWVPPVPTGSTTPSAPAASTVSAQRTSTARTHLTLPAVPTHALPPLPVQVKNTRVRTKVHA